MPIYAPKSESKQFDPVPVGNHVARVYRVIHIGTVEGEWKGEPKLTNKVMLGFELPNEKKVFNEAKGEEPYVMSRKFTLSFSPKASLLPVVEGIIGRKLSEEEAETFDMESLLGAVCLLNVVHVTKEGNTYANIHGTSPLPKGMEAPQAINAPQVLNYDTFDPKVFVSLPEFVRTEIMSSVEYKEKFPDGVPF